MNREAVFDKEALKESDLGNLEKFGILISGMKVLGHFENLVGFPELE